MGVAYALPLISLLGSSVLAHATTTVKLATVAPTSTPWADTLENMKKDVQSKSKGDVKIKTYLGGTAGGEIEIIQGIRRGRLSGGGLTATALASVVPELDVLELPYLFESYEEADYVLDEVLLEPFTKIFAEKGFVLISWAENGWRNIGTKSRPIRKPEDLRNMKIRSQESKVHLAYWKALGANPIPIAMPEVLPALQTGLVEAFDNTALLTLSAEWHTAIKHFAVTEHIYQPAAVVYGKAFWDKLPEDHRKLLMGDGNKLAAESRKAVRAVGDQLMSVLKESGVSVIVLSDSERSAFRKTGEDLRKSALAQMGPGAKKIYDLVLEGKKKFKSR